MQEYYTILANTLLLGGAKWCYGSWRRYLVYYQRRKLLAWQMALYFFVVVRHIDDCVFRLSMLKHQKMISYMLMAKAIFSSETALFP